MLKTLKRFSKIALNYGKAVAVDMGPFVLFMFGGLSFACGLFAAALPVPLRLIIYAVGIVMFFACETMLEHKIKRQTWEEAMRALSLLKSDNDARNHVEGRNRDFN